MTDLPPLQFRPIFRQYLWGGRRLESDLGKELGPGDTYAESWEVVDHGEDQSVVREGPFAGRRLGDLCRQFPQALLGARSARAFPLLFKFLDAQRDLSVQVHPNDGQAARLVPPDRGKTEAWVILAAESGSRVYAGLQPGVDRAAFERAVSADNIQECLHSFEPEVGDCIFIPAGTVHALGAGLLVAEIQQASDTTYRIFDWNRVGQDGKPRPLHIEQALEVIDFESGPIIPQPPQPTARDHVKRLIECDYFVLDRWQARAAAPIGGDDSFHLLAVLSGQVRLGGGPILNAGQTALLPACCRCALTPVAETDLLDIYLPRAAERG